MNSIGYYFTLLKSFSKLLLWQNSKYFELIPGSLTTNIPESVPVSSTLRELEHDSKPFEKTSNLASREPRTFGLRQVFPNPRDTTETMGKAVE